MKTLITLTILLIATAAFAQTVPLGNRVLTAGEVDGVKYACRQAKTPDEQGKRAPCTNSEAVAHVQAAVSAFLDSTMNGPNGWTSQALGSRITKDEVIAAAKAASLTNQCAAFTSLGISAAKRTAWGCP
jgi:hypothetical protein